jgi:hypothetical protein
MACDTSGREERCVEVFSCNLKERDHLEHLGVDGRKILKYILKIRTEG